MKNRQRLFASPVVFSLPLLVAVATGCGGGGGDTSTPDLRAAPLVLTNVPTGCPTTETAADLYSTVVAGSCATANCHGTSPNGFQITSAADLHANLVGKPSKLYAGVTLPYVTANDVSKSWIMYKLTGSQGQYGSKMPLVGTLTSDQVCKFVAWINSGAL